MTLNLTNDQKGFGALEVVLIIVIIGVLGFVGYRVYDAYTTEEASKENGVSKLEKDDKPVEETEERVSLGEFSFVKPQNWTIEKMTTTDKSLFPGGEPIIESYSFSPGTLSDKKDSTKLSKGRVYLIRTSDVVIDAGGSFYEVYDAKSNVWNSIKKENANFSNQANIVAETFGDGSDGTYGFESSYFNVKNDFTIAVYLSESGIGNGFKDHYSFPNVNGSNASNQLQEQIVSLLNSVK